MRVRTAFINILILLFFIISTFDKPYCRHLHKSFLFEEIFVIQFDFENILSFSVDRYSILHQLSNLLSDIDKAYSNYQ